MKKYILLILLPVVYCLLPHLALATVLYSQSANQDIYEGQTFVIDWFLDTENKPINSLDLKLDYSTDTLEVVEANAGSSLINLWIKSPVADNQNGQLTLTGGIANGISSNKVSVFHSVFKAKKTGVASIKLNPSSVILLNDGRGTNEALKFKDVLFNINPKDFAPGSIISSTHPDQNIWYKNRDVQIKFTPKADTDYSFSFSSNIEIIPDDQIQKVPEVFSYTNLPDGIYYFKVNSKVGPSTWQEAGIYRTQIDATSPESFEPIIGRDPSIFGGEQFVSFSTVDKTSGISHYTIKVGLFGKETETSSPYQLHKPFVGDDVVITAYDRAGNSTITHVKWLGYISVMLFKLILILVGLLAVAVYVIVGKQIKKANRKK
jgi:hypothetical protein